MWPGSEAELQLPTYGVLYSPAVTLEQKIATVLEWIDMPESRRPQFMALYIPDVDQAGHAAGAASEMVDQALQRVDQALSSLFRGLKKRGIHDLLNVVIVSDHGMANTSMDRVADLARYLGDAQVHIDANGPMLGIWPKTDAGNVVVFFYIWLL
jgi:membrane-anchored protein YejM (alkaline phosphatase superfamily)